MSERIEIDLAALQYFIGQLKSFNSDLQTNWSTLKSRWEAVSESWCDIKKDQFQGAVGWDEVIRQMENYLTASEEYDAFLVRLYEAGGGYLH